VGQALPTCATGFPNDDRRGHGPRRFLLDGTRHQLGLSGYPLNRVKITLPSLSKLSPLFTLAVLGFASYAIYLEVQQVQKKSHDGIMDSIMAIDPMKIVIAAILVVPALLAIACYDVVAAWFFKLGIGLSRPLGTGLLGYSITNTTGHGVVVGALLRLRIYPRWGVSGKQVGEVVGFGVLTYYMGLSIVAATALLFEGVELTSLLSKLPKVGYLFEGDWFRYAVPVILLSGVGLWFLLVSLKRSPIVIRGHTFQLPGPKIGAVQVLVSIGDLAIASSILYVLLPDHHDLAWMAFVGIFAVVQLAALMSLVPGGIGVFGAIMIAVLSPRFTGDAGAELFASLIAFRVLYYLIPFTIGGITFLGMISFQNVAKKRSAASNREPSTNV
jgi:uncharacterized membrane protein YbhN (UPF0104 family)